MASFGTQKAEENLEQPDREEQQKNAFDRLNPVKVKEIHTHTSKSKKDGCEEGNGQRLDSLLQSDSRSRSPAQ